MYPGSKLLWAMDAQGEIGKRPAPDPWEMDGDAYIAMQQSIAAHKAAFGRKQ